VAKKGSTGCEKELGLPEQLKVADVLNKNDKGILLMTSTHANIHQCM